MVGLGDDNRKRGNMRKAKCLGAMRAVGVLLGMLCALLCLNGCHWSTREASPEVSCHLNLELLGKGIKDYRRAHGELPQVVVGPNGDEHSWRTLLVPYVSPAQSETIYRLDEPWTSCNNRKALWPGFLETYVQRCPVDPSPVGYPFFTSYLMLVRPSVKDSATGEMGPPSLPPDAVLIVESADCRVEFARPRDLPWEDLWKGESPFGNGKLNSRHSKIVKALRVDGVVLNIPKDITNHALRKLLMGTEDRPVQKK